MKYTPDSLENISSERMAKLKGMQTVINSLNLTDAELIEKDDNKYVKHITNPGTGIDSTAIVEIFQREDGDFQINMTTSNENGNENNTDIFSPDEMAFIFDNNKIPDDSSLGQLYHLAKNGETNDPESFMNSLEAEEYQDNLEENETFLQDLYNRDDNESNLSKSILEDFTTTHYVPGGGFLNLVERLTLAIDKIENVKPVSINDLDFVIINGTTGSLAMSRFGFIETREIEALMENEGIISDEDRKTLSDYINTRNNPRSQENQEILQKNQEIINNYFDSLEIDQTQKDLLKTQLELIYQVDNTNQSKPGSYLSNTLNKQAISQIQIGQSENDNELIPKTIIKVTFPDGSSQLFNERGNIDESYESKNKNVSFFK